MRVLIVEDNELNRRVVKHMLATAGLDIAEAEDAELGLELIEGGDYDVVLMDLRMPGMDGLTAIRRIRARTDRKAGMPVVVLTADSGADIREQCLAAGADGMVTKPVEMRALFDAIVAATARRKGETALLA